MGVGNKPIFKPPKFKRRKTNANTNPKKNTNQQRTNQI